MTSPYSLHISPDSAGYLDSPQAWRWEGAAVAQTASLQYLRDTKITMTNDSRPCKSQLCS